MQQITRRVLVVDDEPTLRLGFSYALSSKTTRVDTASTGRQALEMNASKTFDVIILDLRMPDIDGLGVISTLRELGNHTPVVLCSAALNPAAAVQALLNGVVDFLHKPICPAELRGVVDFILSPTETPFAKALGKARIGQQEAALELLCSISSPGFQTRAWIDLITLMLDKDDAAEHELLEKKTREHLHLLAFRLPDNA